jgi:protein TonB
MFEQALLESAKHSPGTQRTCSTAASLLLQTALLATFIIAPILATQVVPHLQERWIATPIPRLESFAPRVESSGINNGPTVSTTAPQLLQPRTIRPLDLNPKGPDPTPVSMHPQSTSASSSSPIGSLFPNSHPVEPPAENSQKPKPVSVLEQYVVVSRVQPIYPQLAIKSRIQGTVHLNGMITSRGTLEELHVLSGHPMLAQAALEAVEQWKFRPYVLNGKPIEVQTEVIVNFSLN